MKDKTSKKIHIDQIKLLIQIFKTNSITLIFWGKKRINLVQEIIQLSQSILKKMITIIKKHTKVWIKVIIIIQLLITRILQIKVQIFINVITLSKTQ